MPTPLQPPSSPRSSPPRRRRSSRFAALFDRKLTPVMAILFFVALAIMCAAAAGIGYVAKEMRHTEVHARAPAPAMGQTEVRR